MSEAKQGKITEHSNTYFVYIVVCKGYGTENKRKIKYYTGHTGKTPHERLMEHKSGHGGSEWMQRYKWKPKYIGYVEAHTSRHAAYQREQEVKRWPHDKKKRKVREYLGRD